MNLSEVKSLLNDKNICFSELDFKSVAEFRRHISPFANVENAAEEAVKVLVISSNNRHKNIELQFVDENSDGNYVFIDLYFGQYFYELFDCQNDNEVQQSIVDEIKSIISNNIYVIVTNNLTKKAWYSDQIFDKRDSDGFGIPGFEKAMERINKPKGIISRLFKSQKQYEIYDWNTYQCIVK